MRALLDDWHMRPVVLALMGLRGYQTVAAMITLSEIGDIHRFPHPRQLMAYLGLVPSESSSGGSRIQGAITKCGNGHLRWIFNEPSPPAGAETDSRRLPRRGEGAVRRRPNQCAQHYRLPSKVSQELTTRQQAIPKAQRRAVQELSWRCQNRLHERGRKLAARGKTRQKVQVAMARELATFVWEVMRITTPLADGTHAVLPPRRERPSANTSSKEEPTVKKKGRTYSLKSRPIITPNV